MATYQNKCLYLQMNSSFYVIHPNGNIERTDMYHPPSNRWKLVGLMVQLEGEPGRKLVALERLTPELVAKLNMKKCHVVDEDHGTNRKWVSESIQRITFYDRVEDTNYYKYSRNWMQGNRY